MPPLETDAPASSPVALTPNVVEGEPETVGVNFAVRSFVASHSRRLYLASFAAALACEAVAPLFFVLFNVTDGAKRNGPCLHGRSLLRR